MTSCTSNLWEVVFEQTTNYREPEKTRTEHVIGHDLSDALSHYTTEAQKRIISIKRMDIKVTYHY